MLTSVPSATNGLSRHALTQSASTARAAPSAPQGATTVRVTTAQDEDLVQPLIEGHMVYRAPRTQNELSTVTAVCWPARGSSSIPGVPPRLSPRQTMTSRAACRTHWSLSTSRRVPHLHALT